MENTEPDVTTHACADEKPAEEKKDLVLDHWLNENYYGFDDRRRIGFSPIAELVCIVVEGVTGIYNVGNRSYKYIKSVFDSK